MDMTMHINLSPEMENYIKGKVAGGFYGNATEVIRDAIRRMQAEEHRIAAFRRAVAEGEAQLDRGEGTEYSRGRMNKLADTARKNLGRGKPIDPDVIP
jgi:antitoxin ParD1/3/4